MARTPSMTVAEAEMALGARPINATAENRALLRKWLTAQNFPSLFVIGLSLKELGMAYNDSTGEMLGKLRKKLNDGLVNGEAGEQAEREMIAETVLDETGQSHIATTTTETGKGHAVLRAWHFNGAISQPHEMLGFIDGAGNYHRTPFREAYEHGGVYTFDEVDRSNDRALLAVNPHLANGVATFPDKQIVRHPNCIIICTANTWGTGANAQYSGATKLDAAFLSRFPQRLGWNIDRDLELKISGNEQWARRVQRARDKAQAAGLKVMIDVRMTLAGSAMIASGQMSEQQAAAHTYLANLTDDQRRMVEAA